MSLRNVEVSSVVLAIREPDDILPGRTPRLIFQKRGWDAILNKVMLYRVVVEETDTEYEVVTVYKTTKFELYER